LKTRPRTYQAQQWGRYECEAGIFEMFALPAGNSQEWPYPDFTDASFLKSREIYTNHLFDFRVNYLHEKIRSHQPERVIFYGTSYKKRFEKIIQSAFMATGENRLYKTAFGRTDCFLISHPTRKGTANAYFENVGRFISHRC
jgi:hypothetical protein